MHQLDKMCELFRSRSTFKHKHKKQVSWAPTCMCPRRASTRWSRMARSWAGAPSSSSSALSWSSPSYSQLADNIYDWWSFKKTRSWKGFRRAGDSLQLQANSKHQGQWVVMIMITIASMLLMRMVRIRQTDEDNDTGGGWRKVVGDRENRFPADHAVHRHEEDREPGQDCHYQYI